QTGAAALGGGATRDQRIGQFEIKILDIHRTLPARPKKRGKDTCSRVWNHAPDLLILRGLTALCAAAVTPVPEWRNW
ncbi:MAG: hypothetical protein KDH99_07295, partial [Alcanivoracaceae bacterium]|nr:hypothetical protein [Alcanivoracaceae bacterium]